jgi:uncharacterized protein involved in exopolysaccharide biosynthesis
MKETENYQFNTSSIWLFVWEKRLPIVIVTVLSGIIATVSSFLITPLYKAEAVVFPTKNGIIVQDLLNSNEQGHGFAYGNEDDIDRLLQIFLSDRLRNIIIADFNLVEHYEIDTLAKYWKTQLINEYKDKISIEPTRFLSIKISVMDTDPQMASDIANGIAKTADILKDNLRKEKAKADFNLVSKEYFKRYNEYKAFEDSLHLLNKKGMLEYGVQVERLTEAYGLALVEKNFSAQKELEKKLSLFEDFGDDFLRLSRFNYHYLNAVNSFYHNYMDVKFEAESNISHIFIASEATPADKKSYPIKSVIVLAGLFSGFLMTLVLLIVLNIVSQLRKQLK